MTTYKKGNKILDIFFDGTNLNLDLRHSFPVEKLSPGLVRDIVKMRDDNIDIWRNGGFSSCGDDPVWIEFGILIENLDENETFKFIKTAKEFKSETF